MPNTKQIAHKARGVKSCPFGWGASELQLLLVTRHSTSRISTYCFHSHYLRHWRDSSRLTACCRAVDVWGNGAEYLRSFEVFFFLSPTTFLPDRPSRQISLLRVSRTLPATYRWLGRSGHVVVSAHVENTGSDAVDGNVAFFSSNSKRRSTKTKHGKSNRAMPVRRHCPTPPLVALPVRSSNNRYDRNKNKADSAKTVHPCLTTNYSPTLVETVHAPQSGRSPPPTQQKTMFYNRINASTPPPDLSCLSVCTCPYPIRKLTSFYINKNASKSPPNLSVCLCVLSIRTYVHLSVYLPSDPVHRPVCRERGRSLGHLYEGTECDLEP